MTSKILEKGCFKPNCMKTTWVKDGYHDQSKKSVQSQVYIAIPYTAKANVTCSFNDENDATV